MRRGGHRVIGTAAPGHRMGRTALARASRARGHRVVAYHDLLASAELCHLLGGHGCDRRVLLVEILLEVRHGGRIPVSDRLKTSTTPLAPRFTSASSVCAHRGASQGWLRFAISRREIARSRDSGRNASLRMDAARVESTGVPYEETPLRSPPLQNWLILAYLTVLLSLFPTGRPGLAVPESPSHTGWTEFVGFDLSLRLRNAWAVRLAAWAHRRERTAVGTKVYQL